MAPNQRRQGSAIASGTTSSMTVAPIATGGMDKYVVIQAPDNVCGYINGNAAAPYGCENTSQTCAFGFNLAPQTSVITYAPTATAGSSAGAGSSSAAASSGLSVSSRGSSGAIPRQASATSASPSSMITSAAVLPSTNGTTASPTLMTVTLAPPAASILCCDPKLGNCAAQPTACVDNYERPMSRLCDGNCSKDPMTLKCTAGINLYCNRVTFGAMKPTMVPADATLTAAGNNFNGAGGWFCGVTPVPATQLMITTLQAETFTSTQTTIAKRTDVPVARKAKRDDGDEEQDDGVAEGIADAEETADVPEATEDVPEVPSEVETPEEDDTASEDVPEETADVADENADVAEETADTPAEDEDVPEETADDPEETEDVPEETADASEETEDVPDEQSEDVPEEQTEDVPEEQTEDVPEEQSDFELPEDFEAAPEDDSDMSSLDSTDFSAIDAPSDDTSSQDSTPELTLDDIELPGDLRARHLAPRASSSSSSSSAIPTGPLVITEGILSATPTYGGQTSRPGLAEATTQWVIVTPSPFSNSSSSHSNTTGISGGDSGSGGGNSNAGAIAGGVIGGLVVVGAIVGFFVWRARKGKMAAREREEKERAKTAGSGGSQEVLH